MTKTIGWLTALVLCALPLRAQQGTAFTYQGRLTDAGNPASGPYDFRFILYDAPVGGSQVGPVVDRNDVVVAEGLFTLPLDFGPAAFDGGPRFLDLAVRPGASSGAYTPLGTRQPLTPAPGALFSATTPWSGILGKPAGFADGVDDDALAALACSAGQVPKWTGSAWSCSIDADAGGDITAVTAGAGLSGGASSGAASLAVSFAGDGTAATVARSDHDHLGQTWSGASVPGLTVVSSGLTGLVGRTDGVADGSRGLFGNAAAVTGATYGVHGRSASSAGSGVFGEATAVGVFTTYGVSGQIASRLGAGVTGHTTAVNGSGSGVHGLTDGLGEGVLGEGVHMGVKGVATETDGVGVYGRASAASGFVGFTTGVRGDVLNGEGAGLYGYASDTAGHGFGLYAESRGPQGIGAFGYASSTTGNAAFGVFGQSSSTSGRAVYGQAISATGQNYGVFGHTLSPDGYAGWFAGDVEVTGVLTFALADLRIDDPLDPENRYLQHAGVASSERKNLYDGVVVTDASGAAEVALPDWFEALNADFRYQLTVIDESDDAVFVQAKVVRRLADGRFAIRTSAPNVTVCWQVTGVRQDAYARSHPLVLTRDKREEERGTYLHPAEWGLPESQGLFARQQEGAPRRPARP